MGVRLSVIYKVGDLPSGRHTVWKIDGCNAQAIGSYETNAEAWRAYDRIMGEPVSKREEVAEWIANKE